MPISCPLHECQSQQPLLFVVDHTPCEYYGQESSHTVHKVWVFAAHITIYTIVHKVFAGWRREERKDGDGDIST